MNAAQSRERAQGDLDAALHAFIHRTAASWSADPGELDRLLLAGFAHQVRWNPAYARFAARRGADPDRITTAGEIPPVPARAFTRLRVATFPPTETVRRFRSSGTTGGPRAVLELDRGQLALYDAALLPPFARHLLPDGRSDLAWLALLPAPADAPESSLAAMVGSAARQLGAEVEYFVTAAGMLDTQRAVAAMQHHVAQSTPVLLLATALALDVLSSALRSAAQRLTLPPGSRVMETGGFKGRRKEVAPGELAAELAVRLGVPEVAVIGEYGMTEMTSQFYDPAFHAHVMHAENGERGHDPRRRLVGPPWVRSLIVDPVTLREVPAGDEGLLLHLDPTARSSAVALLTEDRAVRCADGIGFELRGRMPGADARGCSLALDDLVRAGAEAGDPGSGAERGESS